MEISDRQMRRILWEAKLEPRVVQGERSKGWFKSKQRLFREAQSGRRLSEAGRMRRDRQFALAPHPWSPQNGE